MTGSVSKNLRPLTILNVVDDAHSIPVDFLAVLRHGGGDSFGLVLDSKDPDIVEHSTWGYPCGDSIGETPKLRGQLPPARLSPHTSGLEPAQLVQKFLGGSDPVHAFPSAQGG